MKIVIACDSFKGSLDTKAAGESVAKGFREIFPEGDIRVVEVGDGGEGTVAAIVHALEGKTEEVTVSGPLGDPVKAVYGISGDGKTAVMEMAQASGLTLIPKERRNPLKTSTFGTGEMIMDAIRHGCRTIVMGIGGSATNDGGMGLMAALGAKFLDNDGKTLAPCGENLEKVNTIDLSGLDPLIKETELKVACDVDNTLYGRRGAAYVFAPQKGASPEDVERLDKGLRHYADATAKSTGLNPCDMPGAGAAGGIGYAFAAFLNGNLSSGIDLTLDTIGFDKTIEGADVVITGEGRLDSQTIMGKTPSGVLSRARKAEIPVIALGGSVTAWHTLLDAGFTAVFPVTPGPTSLEEAMKPEKASENIYHTALQIARLIAEFK